MVNSHSKKQEKMSDKRSFIRNFWKERKMVRAMAPSSKYLAKKMLEKIDFSTAKVIVELGPGTGVFTRRMLQKLSPDGILLVLWSWRRSLAFRNRA